MEARKLLEALHVAERLKDVTRHCYTSGGRHESVAEHCWRMALMAYFVSDEFPELDMNKVIKMCLIHDLGEAFTGDIPSFLKNGDDEQKEDALDGISAGAVCGRNDGALPRDGRAPDAGGKAL